MLLGILKQLKGDDIMTLLDPDLDKDVQRLYVAVRFANAKANAISEAEAKAGEAALIELHGNKAGPFHKALMLFPTGQLMKKEEETKTKQKARTKKASLSRRKSRTECSSLLKASVARTA